MKLMNAKQSKFKQIMLKSLSAFFVFWLSSVLVLVGCGSRLFMVSAMNVANEEAESCPLGKGHECCKKQAKVEDNSPKVSEDKSQTIDCCAFKPQKTLSTDLQNTKISKQSQSLAEKFETPKPVYFPKQTYQPSKVYHSAIRNRGSTYLQNCVFRI